MFKINLEKELLKQNAEKTITKAEEVFIFEAESILKSAGEEDIKILQSMGLDNSLKQAQAVKDRESTILEQISGLDKGKIFDESQIKNLCLTYKLRFLPIMMYKGQVDPYLPVKIREFEKLMEDKLNMKYINHTENSDFSDPLPPRPAHMEEIDYRDYVRSMRSYRSSFSDEQDWRYKVLKNDKVYNRAKYLIAAPEESFKLEEKPKDPLLFYPLGNGKYYLVHKWGNDISVKRLISGFRSRNAFTSIIWIALAYIFPVIHLIVWMFGNPDTWTIGDHVFSLCVSFVISSCLVGIHCGPLDGKFHNTEWNNRFKE